MFKSVTTQNSVDISAQEVKQKHRITNDQARHQAGAVASKVLYIVQLPPPVHGVTAMNKYVVNSAVINDQFLTSVVDLKFSKDNTQLEKPSLSKLVPCVLYVFRIAAMMMRFRPKLVYFTLTPTGFAFYRDAIYVLILKAFSAKIVLHLHGKGIHKQATGSGWKRRLYSLVFKGTHVISMSKTLSADVSEIYKGSPYIVANGIQVHAKTNKQEETGDVPHLLFLSNYIENKGVLVLMQALSILKEKGYQFKTRFVGAPSNLSIAELEKTIAEKNLEGYAEIVGPLYGDAKYEEFKKADIFVFPTYNDAFPLVNLEAMQFSLPVISTYEGGVPDIVVNNETGFLVERKNVEMLAEKIALLLDNKKLRLEMGQKGYERFINNFTLQHFESNLKNTLTTILAGS